MFLNGKIIRDSNELYSLRTDITERQEYKELLQILQDKYKFKPLDFRSDFGYVFDAPSYEGDFLTTGNYITLKAGEFKIISMVIKDENLKEISFSLYLNVKGEKDTKIFKFGKGKLELYARRSVEDEADDVEEDLPDDESFKPLSTVFPSLCIPGYQHCGPNCGDFSDATGGGGSPVNPVDVCCRTHDRCWDIFGPWDACCDEQITTCSARYIGQYFAAAWVSETFFISGLGC